MVIEVAPSWKAVVENLPNDRRKAATQYAPELRRWFGRRLRQMRRSLGLTQARLGKLVGKDQTRISRMETGDCVVSVEEVLELCAALNCRPQVLLGEVVP